MSRERLRAWVADALIGLAWWLTEAAGRLYPREAFAGVVRAYEDGVLVETERVRDEAIGRAILMDKRALEARERSDRT